MKGIYNTSTIPIVQNHAMITVYTSHFSEIIVFYLSQFEVLTLLNIVGSHNVTMKCCEFNLNTNLHSSFLNISPLYYEGPWNESYDLVHLGLIQTMVFSV